MLAENEVVFLCTVYMLIFQGILLFRSDGCPKGVDGAFKIARLWVHEVYRVFYDRLVNEQDRETFFEIVKVLLRKNFYSRI